MAAEAPSAPTPDAASAHATAGEPPAAQTTTSFWDIMLPVLGFVGTGIGLLGFVIFFGGFILWTRFEAAGLPADDAVARVPRNDLVATGASFLVPALLAALAAVAVGLVLRDATLGNLRRERTSKRREEHERAQHDLQLARAHAEDARARAAEQAERVAEIRRRLTEPRDAGEAQAVSLELAAHEPLASEAERIRDAAEQRIDAAETRERQTLQACREAAELTARDRLLQIAAGGLPLVVAYGLIGVIGWSGLDRWTVLALVAAALLTIAVAIAVVSMTQNFAWFALCAFVGVGLVIAASTYARTDAATKLSPAAAIADGMPLTGLFVAETDDAVYLAQVQRRDAPGLVLDHDAAALMRVEKDTISALEIGPVMREATAYRRALELGLALCEHRKPATATATKRKAGGTQHAAAGSALTCAEKDIGELRQRLADVLSAPTGA